MLQAEGTHMMTRCQMLLGSLVLSAACADARPGLLGEFVTVIDPKPTAAGDAGAPADPQDAGAPLLDAGASEPVAMPSAQDAGSSSPPPSMTPATPPMQPAMPATQPTMTSDYVAVATQTIGTLPIETEQFNCLTTDLTFDEDTWVTAIEVVPQHLDFTFRATVSFADNNSCDALGITGHNVFDYFPSNHRLELPDGAAIRLPASHRINVQLHYSGVIANGPSSDTQPTKIHLWTLPKGERPLHEIVRDTIHAFNIDIAAEAVGREISTTSAEFAAELTQPGAEIIGITPILHYLGEGVTSMLVAPDGSESTILDLQTWTIDSRKEYWLDPSRYIPVPPGSRTKQTCIYSNRLQDQPLDHSGVPYEPQQTTFGEDARHEQCRMNLVVRYPL
jgi:hypothetical protein